MSPSQCIIPGYPFTRTSVLRNPHGPAYAPTDGALPAPAAYLRMAEAGVLSVHSRRGATGHVAAPAEAPR